MTTADNDGTSPRRGRTTRRNRQANAIAARGVLTDFDGNILIVAPPPPRTFFYLPGDKTRVGERPRAGCFREIREELGIEVRVGEHLHTSWNHDSVHTHRDWHTHLFDCGTHDSGLLDQHIVALPSEIRLWQWVPLAVALERRQPDIAPALIAVRAGKRYIERTTDSTLSQSTPAQRSRAAVASPTQLGG